MNKLLKKIVIIFSCLFLCVFTIGANVTKASGYSKYAGKPTTTLLKTEIVAKENFTFEVTQQIEVNLDGNHGVFINVPYDPKTNVIEDIMVPSNEVCEVKTEYVDGLFFKVVRIGNQNDVLYGKHTYLIKYTIKGTKKAADEHFVALAMIPAFWNMPIDRAETTLIMPKKTNWKNLEMYVGESGSKEKLEDNNKFTYEKTPTTLTIVGKNLPKEYGASIRADVGKGYWQNVEDPNSFPTFYIIFLVGYLLVCLLLWILFGRDPKVVEVVEFYPPENLSPLEIGVLIDGVADNDEISSMFLYYAKKGYVNIKKEKRKVKIIKVKDIDESEPKYSKILFNAMFAKGDIFTPKSVTDDFVKKMKKVKRLAKKAAEKQGKIITPISKFLSYITTFIIIVFYFIMTVDLDFIISSNTFGSFIWLLIIFLCVDTIFISNDVGMKKTKNRKLRIIGLAIAIFVFHEYLEYKVTGSFGLYGICALLVYIILFVTQGIKRHSKKYNLIYGRVLGFKKFIELAELEKLELLVDENPDYFFDILPYAQVFGLTSKWKKKMSMCNLDSCHQPSWYTGDTAFDSVVTMSLINREITKVNSSIGSASSSGSFSSGSGFGGGGGGAW